MSEPKIYTFKTSSFLGRDLKSHDVNSEFVELGEFRKAVNRCADLESDNERLTKYNLAFAEENKVLKFKLNEVKRQEQIMGCDCPDEDNPTMCAGCRIRYAMNLEPRVVHMTVWKGFKPDVLCEIDESCKGTEDKSKVTCPECLEALTNTRDKDNG